MTKPECVSCRFFASGHHRGGDLGQCRKHTPRVDREGGAAWPAVKATDWCGEFAPTPRPPRAVEAVER